MGTKVAPLLRQAMAGTDEEIKKRANKALEAIEKDKSAMILPVQAKLIGYRKPAGAAEVLLAFLPFADEDQVFEEVRGALAAVAVRDGKTEPVLVTALDDKLALRRSVAAEALALGGALDQRAAVRKLLKDTDGSVKLRVALALATARDREAVPVLIDLMGELPFEKGVASRIVPAQFGRRERPERLPGHRQRLAQEAQRCLGDLVEGPRQQCGPGPCLDRAADARLHLAD